MRVRKDLLVRYLESRGQGGEAAELAMIPDEIDTSGDAELLQRLGIDPDELEGTFQGADPTA